MGLVTRRLLAVFRCWERPVQWAVLIALPLLIIAFLVLSLGPQPLRLPAVIGFLGLIVILQGIVLWANRGMVTPYTKAQRCYLNEDFDSARAILEELHASGRADLRSLTLLGNTYRQLGALESSERLLREALTLQQNHHFPLYGLGRTLLVQGRYSEAYDAIQQALQAGAPPIVQLDAVEALYRAGANEEALARLRQFHEPAGEPHRRLFVEFLRYRLAGESDISPDVVAAGLEYWQAHARRFGSTAYGRDLAEDIRVMQAFLGD